MFSTVKTAAIAAAATLGLGLAAPASAAPLAQGSGILASSVAANAMAGYQASGDVWEHGRKRHRHYRQGRAYRNYNAYNNRAYYGQPVHRNTRVWRDRRDGRYYCRKDDGTTGLLIGGAAGALLGREIAGDRTLGAILGAAGGALLGREIDRGGSRCR